uniref:Uncharacterized protein n=1 Tax=Anguilla anguilla TaxID=7936 RepID=A0A0E9RJ24_ANGAN
MYFLIITCLEKACHFNQLPLLDITRLDMRKFGSVK